MSKITLHKDGNTTMIKCTSKMKNVLISIAVLFGIITGLLVGVSGCSDTTKPRDVEKGIITMVTTAMSIRLEVQGIGEVTIYWGDGTVTRSTMSRYGGTRILQHRYLSESEHIVTISGHITDFNSSNNMLTFLDVRNMPMLESLGLYSNQIKSLDVRSNALLKRLVCGGNQLKYLDLSYNPLLYYLYCAGNLIENLDLSNNADLQLLNIRDNLFKSLDISNTPRLSYVVIQGNQFNKEALNNLFDALPERDYYLWKWATIFIADNPGTDECDVSIAGDKGWAVRATEECFTQLMMNNNITEIENYLLWRKHEKSCD